MSKSLHSQHIAVLGCGNLGSSIVAGLLAVGLPPSQLCATSRRDERRAELAQGFGITTTGDNLAAATKANIVLLAAKPQQLAEVCRALAVVDCSAKLIVSVAAGIEVAQIGGWLNQRCAIVRAMPNTPAALQLAATGLYANTIVNDTQRALTETLFSAIGRSVWLADEKWMNWVTALSGSGPAYFYQMMADMVQSAVTAGFPADAAELLVKQTCLGAAHLATQANAESLPDLIRRVKSPGGTTERALNTLAQHHFTELIDTMLRAAEQRGRELSDALKNQ